MSGYESLLTPPGEIEARLDKIREKLQAGGLAGALLVQNIDKLYYSGTMNGGHLLIPTRGDAVVYSSRGANRAIAETPLEVVELKSVRELGQSVENRLSGVPGPLGAELDVVPVNAMKRLEQLITTRELVDVSKHLRQVRAVKSDWEVEAIKRSCSQIEGSVAKVPGFLREGVTETELSAFLEWEMRRLGHNGIIRMRGFNQEMFYGHVMAGSTSGTVSFLDAPSGGMGLGPSWPQGASPRGINVGEPLMVDLMGNSNGYLSDQTRMFSLGEPTPKFLDAYGAATTLQKTVADAAGPGVTSGELYELAVAKAAESPFGGHFLGERYKVSFVGHGLGLEVDEFPFLAKGFHMPLEQGMVFALEPKFVFEGEGVVGVEDTYLVTDIGVERLTTSPAEWGVIEGG